MLNNNNIIHNADGKHEDETIKEYFLRKTENDMSSENIIRLLEELSVPAEEYAQNPFKRTEEQDEEYAEFFVFFMKFIDLNPKIADDVRKRFEFLPAVLVAGLLAANDRYDIVGEGLDMRELIDLFDELDYTQQVRANILASYIISIPRECRVMFCPFDDDDAEEHSDYEVEIPAEADENELDDIYATLQGYIAMVMLHGGLIYVSDEDENANSVKDVRVSSFISVDGMLHRIKEDPTSFIDAEKGPTFEMPELPFPIHVWDKA